MSDRKKDDDSSRGLTETERSESAKKAILSGMAGTKRSSSDALEASELTDDMSKMTRSERKRHREKKRRSDVNKGCDKLMSLLIEIDPEVRSEVEERKAGHWKAQSGANDDILLSRVELISRASCVLQKVHNENLELKNIIRTLSSNGAESALHPISHSITQRQIETAQTVTGHLPAGLHRFGIMANASPNGLAGPTSILSTFEQTLQQASLHEAAMRDAQTAIGLQQLAAVSAAHNASSGQYAIDPRIAPALRSLNDPQWLPVGAVQGNMLPASMAASLGLSHVAQMPPFSGSQSDLLPGRPHHREHQVQSPQDPGKRNGERER